MEVFRTLILLTILVICIYGCLYPNQIISICSQLKCACSFLLLHRSFYQHREFELVGNSYGELNVTRYEGNPEAAGEPVECAVCLCKIDEGDEVRELRCDHLFHRVCLDRWLGHKHTTCPLCRDHIAPGRMFSELGEGLLVFNFCSFGSSGHDRCQWWLR